MRRFTQLFLDLDATGSTTEKLSLLTRYFRDADARPDGDRDAAWALALLTGNRPKRAAATGVLRALALEITGLPEWLVAECHTVAGDLSETLALLLPPPEGASDESLADTIERRVLPMIGASEGEKRALVLDAWNDLSENERLVYHKIVRGGFRLGVQKRLVTRALAEVAGVSQDTMAHRLMGTIEPTPRAYRAVIAADSPLDRGRPYPFFLAHPAPTDPAGADEPLGDRDAWLAEWKWDGIRAQLLVREDDPVLWSRGEESIAPLFPEIIAAARSLALGTVLDGEILLWSGGSDGPDRGTPRPFAELQTRLNRKTPPRQPSLFDDTRAVFLAYDLLESDRVDRRANPLADRRAALETLLNALPTEARDTLRLSEPVDAPSWADLAAQRATARDRGAEGLMLKRLGAPYGVGRTLGRSQEQDSAGRRGSAASSDGPTATMPGWVKWKLDPYAVDAVLIGAQPGSGRRAGLYTDYTFALWSRAQAPAEGPAEGPAAEDHRELVTFAKAYSGLDQAEIERLDRWIRANTTAKKGPFRLVKPVQVFEIGFEGLRESGRHRAGVAVRFPRILRWRTDKPAAEADTLDHLRSLLGVEP